MSLSEIGLASMRQEGESTRTKAIRQGRLAELTPDEMTRLERCIAVAGEGEEELAALEYIQTVLSLRKSAAHHIHEASTRIISAARSGIGSLEAHIFPRVQGTEQIVE